MNETIGTILVLEDERPLLEAIRIKLTRGGFDVVSARSVDDAWNRVRDDIAFDAIWLDHYLLGKENGLDFLVRLRSEKKLDNVPVFVVSNTASEDKKRAYLHLGAKKYFIKADFRLEDIIADIKEAIAKHA